MELYLPPEIPYTYRREDGKVTFTKGHKALKKGLTYDEFYGKERSKEIRKKLAEAHTGKTHPNYYHGKPVVIIVNGKLFARCESATDAGRKLGMNINLIRSYLYGKKKPKNGWKWFFEEDNNWFKEINTKQ